MRRLIGSAVLAAVVIGSALLWFGVNPVEPLVIKNRLEAEWKSLSVTEKSLGHRKQPADWSAGIFLGASTIDSVLQQLVGARLEYLPTGSLASGATIEVKSVRLTPALGNAMAELLLVARKGSVELELGLKGLVSFQGVHTTREPKGLMALVEELPILPASDSKNTESKSETEAALKAALTSLSAGTGAVRVDSPAGTSVLERAIDAMQAAQRLTRVAVQLPPLPSQVTAGMPVVPPASVPAATPKPVALSDPGQTAAIFRIDPLEISPTGRIGPLQFSAKKFWRELLPDLVVAFAEPEILNVSVPLNDGLKFDLGINEQSKEVVNKETKATITYQVTMPSTIIEQRISYAAPVFRQEGIWLLARQDNSGQENLEPEQLPEKEKLQSEVETLRSRVNKLTEGFTGDAKTASIWISSETFSSIGSSLAKLSDASRRISIQSLEREGRLAEEKWQDNLLGDGGAYAELVDGRSASATLQLGKPSVAWNADGLKIEMQAVAAVAANIHLHFDPLIGGGAGTSVGMQGAGSGKAVVSAKPKVLVGENGTKLAAMDMHLSCDAIKTNVTTDGIMKVDMGWIKLPKLGVKATVPIGRQQIGSLALFDNRPMFVPTPSRDPRKEKDEVRRAELIKRNPWAQLPASGGIKLRIVPENIASDASGVRATVSFVVERLKVGQGKDELESARDAINREATAASENSRILLKNHRPVQECSGEPELAVILGPIEFGSNNDIIKFAKNAWNDMTKGPGPGNELRKGVEAIAGAVEKIVPTISTGGSHGGLGVTVGGWKF